MTLLTRDRSAALVGALIDRAAVLCAAQLVVATIAFPFVLLTVPTDTWPRRGLLFLHALVFGGAGILLRFIVHAEKRSRTLGLLLLCMAPVFALGTMHNAAELDGTILAPLVLVFAIKVDALAPYAAWRFASDFPRVPDTRRGQRLLAIARIVSLALAAVLIAANLFALHYGTTTGILSYLVRSAPHSLYFQLQFLLVLGAFVTLIARSRRASVDERRRVSLLVSGLILGTLPSIVWIVLWTLIPRFGEWIPLRIAGWIIYPALLATPLIAAYAVITRRALGVALLFRRAVEHAISRYSVLLLVAAPALILVLDLYRRRQDRLADAFSLDRGWPALVLVAITLVGLRSHRALVERIDRAFFRERYDARHVTAKLVDDCRWVATRDELAALLARGLDDAMHVEHAHLFLLDRTHRKFEDTASRFVSLAQTAPLAALISAAEEGFAFDVNNPIPRALDPQDAAWLTDVRACLIVPLHDAGTHLLGFLVLGAKRSELPFTRDDHALLKSVARAAELTLAYHGLVPNVGTMSREPVEEEETLECVSCGLVLSAPAEQCPACAGTLAECLLPAVVGGNLNVVVRVGAGGMGTVYRALDVDLGRSVALKTLPYLSPDAAARLRREAHIMASLSHEAVASVYAVQSWQGKPVVVYEFLAEGTLADRIARGPLPIADVVSIGVAISAGLEAIHTAGLLHGDIKPSNIGFTAAGRPKLLDFGIASPIASLGERPEHPLQAGTLAYLAPEIAHGGAPSLDSELWSLAITLYEAVTGRQPMIGTDFSDTMRRVKAGVVPPVSSYLPGADDALDDFFNAAFARDGRLQMTRAAEFGLALANVQQRALIRS